MLSEYKYGILHRLGTESATQVIVIMQPLIHLDSTKPISGQQQ